MTDLKTMGFTVKQGGTAIPDPTMMAQGNLTISYMVIGHIVADLQGCVKFHSGDHTKILTNCRLEIRHHQVQAAEEALSSAVGGFSLTEICLLHHRRNTGAWIYVALSTVNETEIGVKEWRDSVSL